MVKEVLRDSMVRRLIQGMATAAGILFFVFVQTLPVRTMLDVTLDIVALAILGWALSVLVTVVREDVIG